MQINLQKAHMCFLRNIPLRVITVKQNKKWVQYKRVIAHINVTTRIVSLRGNV